jgi:hypothetical protein
MKSLLDGVEWRYNPAWSLMEDGEGIWEDDRLSLNAKRIAMDSKEETKSVQRGMRELESCGYLSKRKLGNGRIQYRLAEESYMGAEPKIERSSLEDRYGDRYG